VLWGDGHQRRELVHIDDFVAAAAHLAGSVDGTLVNLGAGEEHSIRQFAGLICELTGVGFDRVHFDSSKYVGAKSKCLSVTRLRVLMPGLRMTPLREGLAQTIAWFEDHLDLLEDPPAAAAA
jgi:GDP-L-fucose synthase